ncbi:hypothetical protein [Alienimonas californiensis]|uniref:Uncharacterized protein n=1 Tax=Alienimonas californiensis TaxID=2527989 RepID=A0A517PDL6_9PLAN|nr:hypothetical protein [Alienimonas californiensis]QDT17472.1 hypothetical protein CA12_35970 [Alienimonas californiensis]
MLSALLFAALAAGPEPVDAANAPPLKRDAAPAETLLGQPRAFLAAFEGSEPAAAFAPTDKKAWTVKQQSNGNSVYALTVRVSDYKPPVRSPHNIALVEDVQLAETIIDVDFQSTMTDYGHRSLCLFFNYQDPSHFYYVHFGKEADPHANQIFVVNDKPRLAISKTTTDGTPWDAEWHHARVVRKPATGEISVYFDDMETPAMTAVDKTFMHGQVGIGSFDDSGAFDNLAVYGTPAEDAAAE